MLAERPKTTRTAAEPRWLTPPPVASADAVAAWRDLAVTTPGAALEHDPEFVPEAALWTRWDDAGDLRGAAVLAPKTVVVRPLPAVNYALRGWRLAGDALLGDGEAAEFTEAVATWLSSGNGDCLLVEDLATESPLWAALADLKSDRRVRLRYPGPPQRHWWIDLPPGAADYWSAFSGKSRNTLKRKAKRLEHDVRCYREPSEVAELLDAAHRVSTTSWQSRRLGLRVRNSATEAAFWTRAAARGAMRCYVLSQASRPLAFVFGVQWGGVFRYEELAYDPEFAEFSPGTVLLYRLLDDLLTTDPPQRFDFGFGDAEYKALFGNRATLSGPVLLVRRGVGPSTVLALEGLRRSATSLARAGLRRLGVLALARRLYRR